MKKYALAIGILLSPLVVLADYNDVSLGQSAAIISVGGVSMTVTGTSDAVQSLTVDASSFNVVMLPASALHVSATGATIFNLVIPSPVTNSAVCDTGTSTLSLSNAQSSSATTVTITPNAVSSCTSSTSSSTTGNGSPGGGGGGSAPAAIVPQTTTTVTPSAVTQAAAMGAVPVALFVRPIGVGSKGADVQVLQQLLNRDPDTRIAARGAGSPGRESTTAGALTVKAIQKFQLKYGIVKRGQSGYGSLGPRTRAKLNELYGGSSSVTAPAAAPSSSAVQTNQLQALQDALAKLKALQGKLKTY